MQVLLVLLALVGHASLWVALVNRLHGQMLPRWLIHCMSLIGLGCFGLIPVGFGLWFAGVGFTILGPNDWLGIAKPGLAYLVVCWVAALGATAHWTWRHVLRRPPGVLRWQRSRSLDLIPPGSGRQASQDQSHHFLVHLPGNETLQLDVEERAVDIPRLGSALDGLLIVHLSDFHFTGRVGKTYFQDVVRVGNQLEADLIAITGDLVDNNDCIDWIPDTLGRLKARYGTYFVLGNHDLNADTKRVRGTLVDSGLVDLGGRWVEIRINDWPLVLAGNELPWIPPAADMRTAPPPSNQGGPPRILLSHSPDQLDWARANEFDLILAGHTHGGQIRFPVIGPILSPSRRGVRYSSGIFHAPPTVMHVTRGVSGKFPIRLNCPPEIAKLVLHSTYVGS